MAELIEELRGLIQAFDRNEVKFALCGGLAVAAHGLVRATQDVDFLIRAELLDAAFQAAAEAGYNIRGIDISFKEPTVEIRRVSKIIDGNVIVLDLLLVTPNLEDVWANTIEIEFAGEALAVVSRDGLIKMKREAGRPQDLADIERLENERS